MSGYDNAPMKPDNSFMDDEMINHFNMSYSSMGGMEIPTTQSYSDSNAYVNNPNHPEYSFLISLLVIFIIRIGSLLSQSPTPDLIHPA